MRHIDDEKVNALREKMLKVTYDNAYNEIGRAHV